MIGVHIENFYTKLYKETNSWRARLDEVILDRILDGEKGALEEKTPENEVFQAILSLAGGKVLGSDGFPLILFQKGWNFLKHDVMRVLVVLHNVAEA